MCLVIMQEIVIILIVVVWLGLMRLEIRLPRYRKLVRIFRLLFFSAIIMVIWHNTRPIATLLNLLAGDPRIHESFVVQAADFLVICICPIVVFLTESRIAGRKAEGGVRRQLSVPFNDN